MMSSSSGQRRETNRPKSIFNKSMMNENGDAVGSNREEEKSLEFAYSDLRTITKIT